MKTTLEFNVPEKVPEKDDAALAFLQKMEISTQAGLIGAVKAAAAIKKDAVDIKKELDWHTEPLKEAESRLRARFKPALDSRDACEKTVKEKIAGYVQGQEDKKQATLKEAEKATQVGDPSACTALIARSSGFEVPKVPGLSLRKSEVIELKDPEAFVAYAVSAKRFDLLQPNMDAVKALAKANLLNGAPGVKISTKVTPVITVAKVGK